MGNTTAIGMLPVRILGRVETADREPDAVIAQLECVDVDLVKHKIKVWVLQQNIMGPFDVEELGSLHDSFYQTERLRELEHVDTENLLVCPACGSKEDVFVNLSHGIGKCENCTHMGVIADFTQQWEGETIEDNMVP